MRDTAAASLGKVLRLKKSSLPTVFNSLNILSSKKKKMCWCLFKLAHNKSKSEIQMFLLISRHHIGVPGWYTSMASPYRTDVA